MTNEQKAQKIIDENLYMTISVATKDGDPWISNLFYSADKKYSFYWYSSKDSNHSKILKENPIAAISIFNSTAKGDEADAVYMKATVEEVSDKLELIRVLVIHGKRLFKHGFIDSRKSLDKFIKEYKDFQGISKLRLYKATPTKIWKLTPPEMFNDKYIDRRIEIDLNTKSL